MKSLSLALRQLVRAPLHSAVVVVILALGLAASTTAFTLVDTLFFKSRAGITDAASLYNIHPIAKATGDHEAWSYPAFRALQEETKSLAGLAAFSGLEAGLARGGHSESVKTQLVSGSFFAVVGVKPALGRTFLPEEERTYGTHAVALISDRCWRNSFGSDPAAVGSAVKINGFDFTIIGVLPPGFHGTFIGFDFDLWVPLAMARIIGAEGDLASPEADWLELIGRLAPGTTDAAAQAEIAGLARPHLANRSAGADGYQVTFKPSRPIDDDLRGSALTFAGVLSVIAGLVLVIACLNVGSLLLTRAEERRRENAVRLALGCGRGRLLQQWLGETLLLFLLGGLGGLLLSLWIADLDLFRTPTPLLELAFDFAPDWRAFAFCFGAAVVAGLLTGLVPALRSARTDVVNDLKLGGHGATGSSRLRHALVVAQVSLALVPVVAAGLLARTLDRAADIPPGFSPENLLVTPLNLGELGTDATATQAAAQHLLATARTLPGVASATLASRMPLGVGSLTTYVQLASAATPPPDAKGFPANLTMADPAYFATLQVPLLAGRAFTDADRAGANPVAIINATMARKLFGSPDSALDREIKRGRTALRVVGVARDVKYSRLWEEPRSQFYLPVAQNPRARLVLAVRSRIPGTALAPSLFRVLRAAQPSLPLSPPLPGSEQIAITLFPQRLGAQIAAVLGGLCLLLAAVGLYAALSLGAAQQMREFSIRAALGAQRSDLLALVARRVMAITALGSVLGGALALAVTRLLQGFLHGINAFDLPTYGGAILLLTVVALVAAWLPSRRAARADPIVALRSE